MKKIFISVALLISTCGFGYAQGFKIGLNYPETGPYEIQGKFQIQAAKMAVDEINGSGRILGRNVQLVITDSKSQPYLSQRNVEKLFDEDKCEMVFGGSSSGVAIAAGKVAREREKLFFGTLTYSNETTREEGHKYIFRECYDAWMGAKVLAKYLKDAYTGKKFFYITADYTWGWTTEQSIRDFSGTDNKRIHRRAYTPFPKATDEDFKAALEKARDARADVLVLVLFGKDMATGVKMATDMGLKKTMAIVVPNLTLGMAESGGPQAMEGVVGALPWEWNIPFIYNYDNGKKFVEKFSKLYNSYPSTSAASAYTILFQYKDAVERVKTTDTRTVIQALENHRFVSLKDEQMWRDFDHSCVQTVYAVKCKPMSEVLKDKFKQDYFEIINTMPGYEAAITKDEWVKYRKEAGKPDVLEWK